jgi:hypothetical protein
VGVLVAAIPRARDDQEGRADGALGNTLDGSGDHELGKVPAKGDAQNDDDPHEHEGAQDAADVDT